MREGIHPDYKVATVKCACGNIQHSEMTIFIGKTSLFVWFHCKGTLILFCCYKVAIIQETFVYRPHIGYYKNAQNRYHPALFNKVVGKEPNGGSRKQNKEERTE